MNEQSKAAELSWATAREVMMEMALEGKIECEKTTKPRIFRVNTGERWSSDTHVKR